jgi:hypothetical protein
VVLQARPRQSFPDHSTFFKNRHCRFRDSDLFRHLFEEVLTRCITEGLVGCDSFGADASLIKADASRHTKVEFAEWTVPEKVTRATREYLDTLDDAAFGAATSVQPKALSPSDPAARFTNANRDRAENLPIEVRKRTSEGGRNRHDRRLRGIELRTKEG